MKPAPTYTNHGPLWIPVLQSHEYHPIRDYWLYHSIVYIKSKIMNSLCTHRQFEKGFKLFETPWWMMGMELACFWLCTNSTLLYIFFRLFCDLFEILLLIKWCHKNNTHGHESGPVIIDTFWTQKTLLVTDHDCIGLGSHWVSYTIDGYLERN